MTNTEKIKQAKKRAAEKGYFYKDPSRDWYQDEHGNQRLREEPSCWFVQFNAYDGAHVCAVCDTEHEADVLLTVINNFHDLEKVENYLKQRREER